MARWRLRSCGSCRAGIDTSSARSACLKHSCSRGFRSQVRSSEVFVFVFYFSQVEKFSDRALAALHIGPSRHEIRTQKVRKDLVSPTATLPFPCVYTVASREFSNLTCHLGLRLSLSLVAPRPRCPSTWTSRPRALRGTCRVDRFCTHFVVLAALILSVLPCTAMQYVAYIAVRDLPAIQRRV